MALRWLLDTNVLAEPLRPRPAQQVLHRLVAHESESALPATTWQELHYGWLRMPHGKRRERLGHYLRETLAPLPILALDAHAARIQAEVRVEADRVGRPMSHPDSEIAAIAIAHSLTLVTRNMRDFEGRPGLRLANWFED